LKLKSAGNKYVFLNSLGAPYTRHDSLNRAFKLALKKAGIMDLRFHDLRHTAGTRLGEKGIPVQVISKILGHSDIRTTMRYVHPEDSLKDAVEKLTSSERNGHIFGHNEN
jgi:integrase